MRCVCTWEHVSECACIQSLEVESGSLPWLLSTLIIHAGSFSNQELADLSIYLASFLLGSPVSASQDSYCRQVTVPVLLLVCGYCGSKLWYLNFGNKHFTHLADLSAPEVSFLRDIFIALFIHLFSILNIHIIIVLLLYKKNDHK